VCVQGADSQRHWSMTNSSGDNPTLLLVDASLNATALIWELVLVTVAVLCFRVWLKTKVRAAVAAPCLGTQCCLSAASVLPQCCLSAASVPPQCRLSAASVPPQCCLSAASVRLSAASVLPQHRTT
jgi:hypothetical protein